MRPPGTDSTESIKKRRWVYDRNLRVKHVGSNPISKYKEISNCLEKNQFQTPKISKQKQKQIAVESFQDPDLVKKVEPWIARDLSVILKDDEVLLLTEFVISLIKRIDMQSDEFLNQLRPFLYEKTEQFAHELISFARSPLNIVNYDKYIQYV